MDIFQENDNHHMKIETRMVKFSNSPEVDASKINFSCPVIMKETIQELSDIGVLSEYTTGEK